jgi:hypothetical protein
MACRAINGKVLSLPAIPGTAQQAVEQTAVELQGNSYARVPLPGTNCLSLLYPAVTWLAVVACGALLPCMASSAEQHCSSDQIRVGKPDASQLCD